MVRYLSEATFPKEITSQEDFNNVVKEIQRDLKNKYDDLYEEEKEYSRAGLKSPTLYRSITLGGHKYKFGWTQRNGFYFKDITTKENLVDTVRELGGINSHQFASYLIERSYEGKLNIDASNYKMIKIYVRSYGEYSNGVSEKTYTLSKAREYYKQFAVEGDGQERYCAVSILNYYSISSTDVDITTYFSDDLSKVKSFLNKSIKNYQKDQKEYVNKCLKLFDEYMNEYGDFEHFGRFTGSTGYAESSNWYGYFAIYDLIDGVVVENYKADPPKLRKDYKNLTISYTSPKIS